MEKDKKEKVENEGVNIPTLITILSVVTVGICGGSFVGTGMTASIFSPYVKKENGYL